VSAPYLWQKDLWENLLRKVKTGRLPHALLFAGDVGLGKAQFADQLARTLLCLSPADDGAPCGTCQACGLLAAGTHPDLRILEPEEEGKDIPVVTVRAVADFFALKGQYGGRQIVIINPAEAMNRFGANGLLKTLEEPTPDALLILVTSQPSLLLPTIRSRCQHVAFQRPDAAIGLNWLNDHLGSDPKSSAIAPTLLALANGAPLEALKLHEMGGLEVRQGLAEQWLQVVEGRGDPLKCAANWAELGLPRAVNWLNSWTMDLIRLKSGADQDVITNTDLQPQLQKLVQRLDLRRLFSHLEQITECSRWSGGQLNTQLALEDIMISWGRRSR
jgi:DNA polymerase-3 subunit delta'